LDRLDYKSRRRVVQYKFETVLPHPDLSSTGAIKGYQPDLKGMSERAVWFTPARLTAPLQRAMLRWACLLNASSACVSGRNPQPFLHLCPKTKSKML
jgi:hypothetical protein